MKYNSAIILMLFITGCLLRFYELRRTYTEGDELIYQAMVEQIEKGAGYSLSGHEILEKYKIDRKQYETKIFFHPPGGIYLFYVFKKIFGEKGFDYVQISSFIIFFWSMVFLAELFFQESVLTAFLCVFSPIMVHVTSYHWLDGPLLAFVCLSMSLFLYGLKNNSHSLIICSGIALGYASLIKLTAFFVIPGMILTGFFMFAADLNLKKKIIILSVFLLCALIIQTPWFLIKMSQTGIMMLKWPGRPTEELSEGNKYVYYLTHVRNPWIYFKLLPGIFWTSIPGLMIWIWSKSDKTYFKNASLLLFSIFFIILIHVFLGFIGYSKVMRYVILITPFHILFFVLSFKKLVLFRKENMSVCYTVLFIFSVAGIFLEVLQGIYTGFFNTYDIILPFF